ncbi:fungal-specific transcription factor domain-containing protein [Hypoxylon sp. FL1284]|nr:fungal-specific transcription factor domain-containing protein [Hypoxylon sp. FL1284]
MGDPLPRSTHKASSRLARSARACLRCRRRKGKCDLRYPKCSSCEAARVPCLAYDSEKQAEVPRNYVSILEEEVRQLKSEVSGLRRQSQSAAVTSATPAATDADYDRQSDSSPVGPATVQLTGSDPQEVVKSMGLVMLESSSQPKFIGTSSGVTFAKMVLACVKADITIPVADPGPARGGPIQVPAPNPIVSSSLPPRHAAQHIMDVYFRHRTPHVPVLTRAKVSEALERVYGALETTHGHDGSSGVADRDLFIAYIVFAVGLCSMPLAGGSRPPQSEGCFNSALRCVDRLLSYSPSDLETLTVVLLLAQYISLNPSKGGLWQLTGLAIRQCIDAALHWESGLVLSMDAAVLDERRRLFWATYRFDRILAITLGRPFGIADQSINTGLPDPYSPQHMGIGIQGQRMANHIIDLYKLESEIKHVLYHQLQGATLAYPRANYPLWLRDVQPRLRAWKDAIPDVSQADPDSIYSQQCWWDARWLNAILLLHRPNPLVPRPTTESLETCFDAACQLIKANKTLQREGRICVIWQYVHGLFLAGLTMIYCLWEEKNIRDKARIIDVMNAAQDCASTLTALVERFPEASGCRDVFESLSSATLKWLVARGQDSSNENALPTLSNEINALRQHIPFSASAWRAEEPASIFPEEPFEFAEYLMAASQWPAANVDMGAAFTLQEMFEASHVDLG